VILEPFNFVTSPAKKGNPNNYPNTGFNKQPEYLPDPYSRKNEFAREELKKDLAKRQEAPFKNTHYGNRNFYPDEKTY